MMLWTGLAREEFFIKPARAGCAADNGHAADVANAEMITKALAVGPSSVIVRSIRASYPAGVMAARRRLAPPVSSMVGRPEDRFTTPISRHHTPARNPVPSAFAHASLAANRLA